MAIPTDTELRELKELIAAQTQRMEIGFAEIKGEIKVLDQRITGLDDRMKNQDTKFWTLVTIMLGTASTLLIKLLGFPTTP